jgi:hypothetical protein
MLFRAADGHCGILARPSTHLARLQDLPYSPLAAKKSKISLRSLETPSLRERGPRTRAPFYFTDALVKAMSRSGLEEEAKRFRTFTAY